MIHFCSSIATPVPSPLLCSTRLTFFLNIFWVIHRELFFPSSEKTRQTQKKIAKVNFFVKSLAYSIQVCWSGMESLISYFKVFSEIYGIVQIIDTFCSSPLIFLNMAYISYNCSYKEWKDILASLHSLSPWLSYALCVYLTFITQYSNILCTS